jgi:hypothetical protein
MAPQFTGRGIESTLTEAWSELSPFLDAIEDESERFFVHRTLTWLVFQPDPVSKDLPRHPLDMLFLANFLREIYREKAFLSGAASGTLTYPD